jgi:hypothetical protein
MRRVSAFLIIATLLVALVPSVTLAGKPLPPEIDSLVVEWNGVSQLQAPKCELTMTATLHGRGVSYIGFYNTAEGTTSYEPTVRKSYTVTTTRALSIASLNAVVFFQAIPLDRKHQPFVDPAIWVGGYESWSGTACPSEGTLMSWTATP